MKNNSIIEVSKSLESLYLKKDYDENINLLLKNKNQFDLGLFHFNLGTLQAKNNQLAASRYNLEKAKKLGQVDSKLKNNLDFVIKKLEVQDISNTTNTLDKVISSAAGLPSNIYLSLSLTLLFIISLLWFTKKLRNIPVTILFLFLAALPFSCERFYFSNFQYAVNLKNIDVYEGPSKVYEKKLELSKGSKILISGPRDGWFFIEKPISLSGWIEKKGLGIL